MPREVVLDAAVRPPSADQYGCGGAHRESRLHCYKTIKQHTRSEPENGKTIKQNPRLGPKSGKTKKQNKTRSSEDHSPKGREGRGVRGLDHGQQLLHDLLVQQGPRGVVWSNSVARAVVLVRAGIAKLASSLARSAATSNTASMLQRKSGLPAIDRQGAGRGASERGGGGSLVGDTGVAP